MEAARRGRGKPAVVCGDDAGGEAPGAELFGIREEAGALGQGDRGAARDRSGGGAGRSDRARRMEGAGDGGGSRTGGGREAGRGGGDGGGGAGGASGGERAAGHERDGDLAGDV